MAYLIDAFCKIVLQHENKTVNQLYNYFIQKISDEESAWTTSHFMLFVKAGEACRQAPTALKEEILKLL